MRVRAEHPLLIVLASSGTPDRAEPTPTATRRDLVERCRRGDRQALDEVFREHAANVERVLSRLIGPRADVEDLLQDTFSAAILAFPSFRGEASIGTWLHRIAIHVAYKHLRRPRHRREVPLDADVIETAMQPSPALEVEHRETLARVYAHLDAIEPRKRIAFLLHVIEEFPIAKVAALTGASKTATKSRIFWARRALLKKLRRDPGLGGEA